VDFLCDLSASTFFWARVATENPAETTCACTFAWLFACDPGASA
jgi:hypothetical protein